MSCSGTTTHRALFKGWQLPPHRGSLGIATVGDAFLSVIPSSAQAPCSVKQARSGPCMHLRALGYRMLHPCTMHSADCHSPVPKRPSLTSTRSYDQEMKVARRRRA
jgi:hypothetical protein